MQQGVDLLLVSSVPATQYVLLQILEDLPVNVVNVDTARGAKEVLAQRAMAIVLCDERLADGSYRDLLSQTAAWRRKIPLVVILDTDGWDEYHEALGTGAADAVRWPARGIDVELALIRALRSRVAAMAAEA